VGKNMSGRPKPRKWVPKHPEKYIGDVNNIIARSSWEIKMLNWLDNHPSVICFNSEGLVVPYLSPVDNRQHRYYVDFLAKMVLKDGSVKTYAIEVKPKAQCMKPKPNKNKARMITEMTTYIINQAKWVHANEHCTKLGIMFLVLNEEDLGIA
jgi:hypothetical protein